MYLTPPEFFNCLVENRPFDHARAVDETRSSRFLPRHMETTREMPMLTDAEAVADLDSRAEVPPTRPAREWPQRALDRLLADVVAPSLNTMAIEAIRRREVLDVLTPDWSEHDGRRVR
jgi:hypothetical protein